MKYILAILLSVMSLSTFAANGPTISVRSSSQSKQSALPSPGYCEIEVANRSHLQAIVDIYYDDAAGFRNNYVQPGHSLFVDLNYNGYCHARSFLVVSSSDAYLLYAKYTSVHSTVDITTRLRGKGLIAALRD